MVYSDEFKKKVIDYYELTPSTTNHMKGLAYDCVTHSLEIGDEIIGTILLQSANKEITRYEPVDLISSKEVNIKLLKEVENRVKAQELFLEWCYLRDIYYKEMSENKGKSLI